MEIQLLPFLFLSLNDRTEEKSMHFHYGENGNQDTLENLALLLMAAFSS